MEIRDPVHGSIEVTQDERFILEHPFFQRLRNIKQLGFSEYVFPGATHTRYLHSIGVMEVANKVFGKVFAGKRSPEIRRLRKTIRLACLLHDIGHAPLSHTTEFVMPQVSELKLPKQFAPSMNRQATHEDYTIKAIVDSDFSTSFEEAKKEYGVSVNEIASLITGECLNHDYFTIEGINYFPFSHQLVSSEMDCDRMDYLLRDSYFCGVSYGKFDLDWIIDNLHVAIDNSTAYLGISERAVATFDDFLLCRFHMFLMVYFHYKPVCLEKMLKRYFASSEEYRIPADISQYLFHDDQRLMKTLRESKNLWAQRIITNNIPMKVFETFGTSQQSSLKQLELYLTEQNIDFIKCSSKGRLSKYYGEDGSVDRFPLKVVRSNRFNSLTSLRNIHEATDLFSRYSDSHSVNRIHLDFLELSGKQQIMIEKIIS